jgi:hypothetical protein
MNNDDRVVDPQLLPDAYREELWKAISASWDGQVARRSKRRAVRNWAGMGIAIAAVLAVGVFIGRQSNGPGTLQDARGSDSTALILASPRIAPQLSTPYRVALNEHFRSAETLLVLFDASGGDFDPEIPALARDLAASTRLLLDSRAGEDAAVREVLLDLELLLVQIARLVEANGATERQIVREGVERSTVLPRLRQLDPERPNPLGI